MRNRSIASQTGEYSYALNINAQSYSFFRANFSGKNENLFSFSGESGKLYDGDGNYFFSYSINEPFELSGNCFSEYHNYFINSIPINFNASKGTGYFENFSYDSGVINLEFYLYGKEPDYSIGNGFFPNGSETGELTISNLSNDNKNFKFYSGEFLSGTFSFLSFDSGDITSSKIFNFLTEDGNYDEDLTFNSSARFYTNFGVITKPITIQSVYDVILELSLNTGNTILGSGRDEQQVLYQHLKGLQTGTGASDIWIELFTSSGFDELAGETGVSLFQSTDFVDFTGKGIISGSGFLEGIIYSKATGWNSALSKPVTGTISNNITSGDLVTSSGFFSFEYSLPTTGEVSTGVNYNLLFLAQGGIGTINSGIDFTSGFVHFTGETGSINTTFYAAIEVDDKQYLYNFESGVTPTGTAYYTGSADYNLSGFFWGINNDGSTDRTGIYFNIYSESETFLAGEDNPKLITGDFEKSDIVYSFPLSGIFNSTGNALEISGNSGIAIIPFCNSNIYQTGYSNPNSSLSQYYMNPCFLKYKYYTGNTEDSAKPEFKLKKFEFTGSGFVEKNNQSAAAFLETGNSFVSGLNLLTSDTNFVSDNYQSYWQIESIDVDNTFFYLLITESFDDFTNQNGFYLLEWRDNVAQDTGFDFNIYSSGEGYTNVGTFTGKAVPDNYALGTGTTVGISYFESSKNFYDISGLNELEFDRLGETLTGQVNNAFLSGLHITGFTGLAETSGSLKTGFTGTQLITFKRDDISINGSNFYLYLQTGGLLNDSFSSSLNLVYSYTDTDVDFLTGDLYSKIFSGLNFEITETGSLVKYINISGEFFPNGKFRLLSFGDGFYESGLQTGYLAPNEIATSGYTGFLTTGFYEREFFYSNTSGFTGQQNFGYFSKTFTGEYDLLTGVDANNLISFRDQNWTTNNSGYSGLISEITNKGNFVIAIDKTISIKQEDILTLMITGNNVSGNYQTITSKNT